jgi:hypothetical protein
MDHPGDQPFAGASFPLQQDGRHHRVANPVEAGQMADLGAQGLDRRGLAEEAVEGVGRR